MICIDCWAVACTAVQLLFIVIGPTYLMVWLIVNKFYEALIIFKIPWMSKSRMNEQAPIWHCSSSSKPNEHSLSSKLYWGVTRVKLKELNFPLSFTTLLKTLEPSRELQESKNQYEIKHRHDMFFVPLLFIFSITSIFVS